MIDIYGKNVIQALLNADVKVFELCLRDDVYLKDKSIVNQAQKKNIKITVLDKIKMNNRFQGLNQGYGAKIDDIKTKDLEEVIDTKKKQLFLILDQIEDPHNLGAMLRSADAFSVDAIIIPNHGGTKINETVVKVSTGSIFYVPIVTVTNINQAISKLKENNVWVYGADMDGNIQLGEVKFDHSIAVVIGSEGFGIRPLVKKNCDYILSIPMTGYVNSLNASVACGIILANIKIQQ